MNMRIINYIIFSIFILTAIGLFVIKNKVISLSNELAQINTQIAVEKKQIYLLRAEIAYLTSPAILKQFADNHKELKPVRIDQIIIDPSLGEKYLSNNNKITNKSNMASNIKWRLKKSPNRYLQQAVMKK